MPGVGQEALACSLTDDQLQGIVGGAVEKIFGRMGEVVAEAGLGAGDIGAVFLTGGSSLMPMIRQRTQRAFPASEIVHGDAFASVGLGLTLAARSVFA